MEVAGGFFFYGRFDKAAVSFLNSRENSRSGSVRATQSALLTIKLNLFPSAQQPPHLLGREGGVLTFFTQSACFKKIGMHNGASLHQRINAVASTDRELRGDDWALGRCGAPGIAVTFGAVKGAWGKTSSQPMF